MTKKSRHSQATDNGPSRASYKVGKGKPPQSGKFKKGASGNSRGRPKGSKNLSTLINEAAWEKVTVTTKTGETKRLSRIQTVTLQLANKAAQGEPRSMLKFMDWVDQVEREAAAARAPEPTIAAADLEVLKEVYQRMKFCAASE